MSSESQDRPELVLVQNSGLVDDDAHMSALDVFYEMDERRSPYIKEVLDWYRKEDAGGLRINELSDNMTDLKRRPRGEEFGKVRKNWQI